MLMPYQSGIYGALDKNRNCDELWRNTGLLVPVIAFSGTSSYLVALIVLLRLLMLKQPMNYENVHQSVSRIGCITIWVFVLLICSVKFIVSLPFTFHRGLYGAMVKIENSGLLMAPILLKYHQVRLPLRIMRLQH